MNVDPEGVTTGAHVSSQTTAISVEVQASTLDMILNGSQINHERIFMKLDLQGYELQVWRAAKTRSD